MPRFRAPIPGQRQPEPMSTEVEVFDTPSQNVLSKLSPYWDDNTSGHAWPPRTNYYEHYALWSGIVKPINYLEIGVMYGWSCMAVLAGWPGIKKIVVVDSEYYNIPITEAKRRILGYCTNEGILDIDIEIHKLDTTTIDSLPVTEKFDLMHVDGQHSAYAAYHDLILCEPHLSERGMIIVDDLKLPGIKEGADKFLSEHPEFDSRIVFTHQVHYLLWKKS